MRRLRCQRWGRWPALHRDLGSSSTSAWGAGSPEQKLCPQLAARGPRFPSCCGSSLACSSAQLLTDALGGFGVSWGCGSCRQSRPEAVLVLAVLGRSVQWCNPAALLLKGFKRVGEELLMTAPLSWLQPTVPPEL